MESNTKPRDFEDSLLTDGEIIEDRLKPKTSHLSVIGEVARKANKIMLKIIWLKLQEQKK